MIIAYDLGTGGIKASLVDENCTIIKSTYRPYSTVCSPDGRREQRPDDWWNALKSTTEELLSAFDASKLCALAMSGHSMGIVPVDKNGRLLSELTPIWADDRGGNEAEAFFKETDRDAWYRDTGCGSPPAIYPIFKLMHCKAHTPSLYEDTYCFLGTKDYLNYRLCGNMMTDFSYASGMGIMSQLSYEYNRDYIRAAGLDESKLPIIGDPCDIVGYVSKEASQALGLPRGLPVICGGVDNACMALGASCVKEGDIYASLGTSAWVAVTVKEPLTESDAHPYTFAHAIRGLYLSHAGTFSSGSAHNWAIDKLFPYLNRETRYADLEEMAKRSPVGANGLIFVPALAGGTLADPSPRLRGAYANIDLSTTADDFARATLEGIAMHLKYISDKLTDSLELSELVLTGGSAKSEFWSQLYADIFGNKIVRPSALQQTATLGAAAIAMVGSSMQKSFDFLSSLTSRDSTAILPRERESAFYAKRLVPFSKLLEAQAQIYPATELSIE